MNKGEKVSHSRTCEGGKCRGACNTKDVNFFVFTGERKGGKTLSQVQMGMAQDPKVFKFPIPHEQSENLWKQYEEVKTKLTRSNQERSNWETLGRILGMARAAGEIDAFLEGFRNGEEEESEDK